MRLIVGERFKSSPKAETSLSEIKASDMLIQSESCRCACDLGDGLNESRESLYWRIKCQLSRARDGDEKEIVDCEGGEG